MLGRPPKLGPSGGAALDPELRAYLDSMRAEMAAIERRGDAKMAALAAKIDDAHHETGSVMEAIVHVLKRAINMLLPLEASAADHERRIKAVEKRR